jgi:hypothetical protein
MTTIIIAAHTTCHAQPAIIAALSRNSSALVTTAHDSLYFGHAKAHEMRQSLT